MGWDDQPPDQDLAKTNQSWDTMPPDADLSKPNRSIGEFAENLGNNALKYVNPIEIGKSLGNTVKQGLYDIPKAAIESSADLVKGSAKALTGGGLPSMQDVTNSPFIKQAKEMTQPIARDPVDYAYKNPIDAAMILATPFMALKGPPVASTSEGLGGAMRDKGASLGTDLGEVSGNTVSRMNPNQLMPESQSRIRMAGDEPNIADIRRETGAKLVNEGVVGGFGQDIGDRIQSANEKVAEWGPAVDKAYDAIKEWNKSTGEYKDVNDALHVDATPILKNILDTANDLSESARSGISRTSRFWRETYNSLASKAEANDGRLSLDDIRSELQDVGKDLKGNRESPRVMTNNDIYAHLAKVREEMVNEIADKSGNAELASNFKKANANYSFWEKIKNDLHSSGAGGEVPENMGRHIVKGIMRGSPQHVAGFLGLRKLLDAVEPAMAQKLFKYGPLVQKYAGPLEVAARQGARQLAITNHLISQKDPEYRAAMQSQ